MKQSGAGVVFGLALVVITGLSVMYWKEVGEKLNTASTSVDGKEMPVYSVEKEKPEIALTFNVTGGNENIEKILEILDRQQTKATFFVTGDWVEKYPEDTKAILAAGHDLGNNGERHRMMSELSAEECRKEIMQLHERVKNITGYEMKLFRPPYGEYNNTVIKTAYACGYYPVCWNVDSLDWKNYGADDMRKRVTENEEMGNGAIILFRTGSRYMNDTLEQIVDELKEKGYLPVAVSRLIYTQHYQMDISGRQIPEK